MLRAVYICAAETVGVGRQGPARPGFGDRQAKGQVTAAALQLQSLWRAPAAAVS